MAGGREHYSSWKIDVIHGDWPSSLAVPLTDIVFKHFLHIGNGGNGGAPWADDCFIADVSSCAKIFLRAIVN